MPKTCNYAMKAGFIISCPDFYHGKIFTNENLTDKVAHEYLTKYPHMESYFQKIPSDELIENKQRPGFEEQIDNEKYEVKVRDWSKAKQYGVAEMLTALNKIRRAHPAALSYHNLTVLPTSDPNILAFARHTPAELTGTGQADTLIVVVNLDGHNAHQSMIHLELSELGLPTDRPLNVRDELTGREFQWGWDNYVSLAPWADVAHILSVQ